MIFNRSCPRCGNGLFRRSHRYSMFDRIASTCGLNPYRCGVCGHRYHGFKIGPAQALGLIGLAILVFLASLTFYSPLEDPNRQMASGDRVLTYTPPPEMEADKNR